MRQVRLELTIPSALASKTNVYTIPPLAHIWCPQQDLNLYFILRRNVFYPLNYKDVYWRKAEESNPIPFLRTQFSRLVAGPTPLHYFPLIWRP